ncbi:MAG: hypothetical protein DMG81_11365 [Acidobacteria bacterium]|nr:MAG: hypothetical protein DMG81_11365 [Acidobacteriota bacterium]
MGEMTSSWAALLGLGAFHGINPGMGWLFAVALGLQERRRGAVLSALLPLGVGHALAVAAAILLALGVGAAMPLQWLRWLVAAILIGFGISRLLRHRHPRWASMRVSKSGLTLWSFLMASAHGAGLMVVPLFLAMSVPAEHAHHAALMNGSTPATALLATGLHALGYLLVTAVVAFVVFEKFGVGILRKSWFNLDLLWAIALIATGVLGVLL